MLVVPKTSFNYNDLIEYKINHTVIEQVKARTRFTYKIDEFLNELQTINIIDGVVGQSEIVEYLAKLFRFLAVVFFDLQNN